MKFDYAGIPLGEYKITMKGDAMYANLNKITKFIFSGFELFARSLAWMLIIILVIVTLPIWLPFALFKLLIEKITGKEIMS